jgi:phosphoglycerate dehydrogenase-like enzyme
MNSISVFIFDEIFESMVGSDRLAELKAMGAELHFISKKCKISAYDPIRSSGPLKVLCINPDFVNWTFGAADCKGIPELRVIISSSDNISWLDTHYADAHGIQYIALENLTTEYRAVAEYAVTIMTSLARSIPLLNRDGFPLDYAHDFIKYQGQDIAGKTAGIIGLGNIGGAIAKLCSGLGMRVVYWSRSKKSESIYEYREIDDLLRESDVIFPTLKPNSETKFLLPNERLEPVKHDAIVVSVVSGLIDNDYLTKRTADKKLFGFGFGADPNTFSDYAGNVWAVPDYAWATKDNMNASYGQFVEKITDTVKQLA